MFQVNDIIRGTPTNSYGITNKNMTKGIVERVDDETKTMLIKVLEHSDDSEVGFRYSVSNDATMFELIIDKEYCPASDESINLLYT